MTRQEQIRADIIAAQAKREAAATPPAWPKSKARPNRPSRPIPGSKRFSLAGKRTTPDPAK